MIARALYGQMFPRPKLLKPLLRAGIAADEALVVDGFSEPFIARAVTEASLRQSGPLRVRTVCRSGTATDLVWPIKAEANRGLAGIDGVVATALGYAENHDSATTYWLIGDQAMLHDAGSLRPSRTPIKEGCVLWLWIMGAAASSASFLCFNPEGIEKGGNCLRRRFRDFIWSDAFGGFRAAGRGARADWHARILCK